MPTSQLSRRTMIAAAGAGTLLAALATAPRARAAASGDTFTADSDTPTAEINAWLAAGGQRRLVGSVLLTAPMVIPSGTSLDATDAGIVGPTTGNILRNAASVPARTATMSTRAGSTTVTARTAVFDASMIGRRVQVLGAGPRAGRAAAPGSMYGVVVSVPSATTAVLSVPATSTLATTTGYVFPPNDSDLSVTGGVWVNRNKNTTAQTTAAHGILIRRASTVTITGITALSTGPRQVGGQYAISLGDVQGVSASDLSFVDLASDGIHVQGPASAIRISDVRGSNSGDDLVAFTGVDGQSKDGSLLGDVEGDIDDVVVDRVAGERCHTHLKVTSGIGAAGVQRRITRFTARNISGTTTGGASVNVVDYAGTSRFSGTIGAVSVVTSSGPVVNLAAAVIDDATVDTVEWPAAATRTPDRGIVRLAGRSAGTVSVGNVVNRSTAPSPTGTACAVAVETTSIARLTVTDTSCPVLAPHFDSVRLGAPSISIATLVVQRDASAAKSGNVFSAPASAPTYRVKSATITDVDRSTGSVWNADVDGGRTTTDLVVERYSGGRAVALVRSPMSLTVRELRQPAASGAGVRLLSENASPSRVVVESGTRSQQLLSRSARQTVSAVSPTIGLDAALLTPRDGDVVLNVNPSLPKGVVRWDAASGRWVPTTRAAVAPQERSAAPTPSATSVPTATPAPTVAPTPTASTAPTRAPSRTPAPTPSAMTPPSVTSSPSPTAPEASPVPQAG